MRLGREQVVFVNAAHEAGPHMFPTCHSVTGERNYLSPIAAVWDAWKLRGEVISQSFDGCFDRTALHQCVYHPPTTSLKSVLCISQEPQSVRRMKRVQFDDCIEVASSTESGCSLYRTFATHGDLHEWSDKPWHYSPKPPSRQFSWRKLTDLTYPFCDFADKSQRTFSNDGANEVSCHSPRSKCTGTLEPGPTTACPCDDAGHDRRLCTRDKGRKDLCSSVLREITNTTPHDFSVEVGLRSAPLSAMAALSSLPEQQGEMPGRDPQGRIVAETSFEDKENQDPISIVQIGRPTPYAFKNSPIDLQQAYRIYARQEGHAQHTDGADDFSGDESEGSEGHSPGDSAGSEETQPSAAHSDRQDVILFHLDDQPIRSYLNWNSYEEMMTEIAHHYSLRREEVVDAYEVVVSPPDIGNVAVPVVVHVFGDIPPESTDRLVLVDIEYHAHRIENNFRTGPSVIRSVKSLPMTASRNDVLHRFDIDKYCRSEKGRCLVFINSRRWPDYDLDKKTIAHGDYVRVAVPPSDRFACPTVAISDMIQRGYSDQQIIDELYNDDAASGFSPSLLGDDEVRMLATNGGTDADDVFLMQKALDDVYVSTAPEADLRSGSSDSESVVQDWFVDLQRIVEAHYQQCSEVLQNDFMFSIYTWFIDQETATLCREPKIAILGEDPAEWREDILLPWEYHLIPGNTVLIDLVQPFTQRPGIEEHIAHVILTQRPLNLNSVLFSMEFVDEVESNVVVTFAVAVPNVCNARILADRIPLFDAFYLNRRQWAHPEVEAGDQDIATRYGLGIKVQIFPASIDDANDRSDSSSLIQFPNSGSCAQKVPHISYDLEISHQMRAHSNDGSDLKPRFDNFSLTEEFIRYVQAVGTQGGQGDVLPELPEGMTDQPTWVQDLWEKWVEIIAQNGGDPQNGLRLETWFTNPRRWTRCEHSRVVVLSSNFHQWERELLGAWHDRAELALPTQFAIVFPTPDDVDRTVQEQLVIEQQSEPFSRTIVVTVCDTHRNYGRQGSIALVVSDRLNINSLSTLLGYSEICPPEREDNECLLWVGNIAIRPDQTLQVRTGNALRFLVRRGIRVSIPELLSMSDQQLRNELRAAIGGAVFRRPNVPGFPADPHSTNNPAPSSSAAEPSAVEYPPDWLNQLQEVFDRNAFLEHSEEGPVMYILVWFVQGMVLHFNDSPKVVRLDADNQWWRSEIIFPWRDQFTRGAPIELYFVDPMPPSHPWQSHAAHIIVAQSLPDEHVAVLAASILRDESIGPVSQAAMIVHSFSGTEDFANRIVGSEVARDVTAQRGSLVFPPDRTVRVGSGDGIVLSLPSTAQASNDVVGGTSADMSFEVAADEQARAPDAFTSQDDVFNELDDSDVTLLLQRSGITDSCKTDSTSAVAYDYRSGVQGKEDLFENDVGVPLGKPSVKVSRMQIGLVVQSFSGLGNQCPNEKMAPESALGLDSGVPPETEFFQFNPDAEVFIPGEALPDWAQVIEDIYHVWDVHAFAWQGESRATHFMTWYVAPTTGRIQCLYGRRIALFADFWNWRENFRRKWEDELDPHADFQLVLVFPPPTQMEPGIVGHVIIIQHNSPEWSSLILTTFDPAINGGRPFHRAFSFTEQLQFQEVLVRVGYTLECVHHAQCVFRLRSQLFAATERIRATDGDAVDLIVNRHYHPAHWNPPFVPQTPGAEGLELLQRSVTVKKGRTGEEFIGHHAQGKQKCPISLHKALQSDDRDVDGSPFTLAELFNQYQVKQSDFIVCVWEMHNGSNHFELHPKCGFDLKQINQQFRARHTLIQDCSELYSVKFTRDSWHFQPSCWRIGSIWPVSLDKALVACVVYDKGCASVRVVTLPSSTRTDFLRDVLNVIHGSFVRVNGVIAGDVVALENGDVLEYHSADHGQLFQLERSSRKVQICLDATVTSHRPVFDEDGEAFEVLPGASVRDTLENEDARVFQLIPEGTDLHRETFEALHVQHELHDDSVIAHELFVDGATHGNWSAWAVVAVSVTESGRAFKGCIGDVTEIDKNSPRWIGAEGHTNVDAELTAMAVATAFACFGSVDSHFTVRPDLALSKRFLDIDSTSRQSSILAKVVHVLGQIKPANVEVTEVRAHRGDPWNELADSVAKWIVRNKQAVGSVPWGTLHYLADSPTTQRWEWIRQQNAAFAKTMPKLHGGAVWQPTPSCKRVGVRSAHGLQSPDELHLSLKVATYNGLALDENDGSSITSGARSLRLDSQFHNKQIAVVGIQESRTSAGTRCTDNYKIFSYGYEQCGRSKHFGCELWLHKALPISKSQDGSSIRLNDCKVTVIVSDPRLLVAQLEGPICICFIVAHAPCVSADRPFAQVKQWWTELSGKVSAATGKNAVMLIDANAPLADHATEFFGVHQAEEMNPQGFEFQDFLIANEFHVPSTFASHCGPSATWHHPRGSQLRRDYILLSRSMFIMCVKSHTWSDFDGGFGHLDHCPAVCHLEGIMMFKPCTKKMRWDFSKMHDVDAQKAFAEALKTLPVPTWEVSIDDHSALLESNILQLATQHFGTSKRVRVRPILSEGTIAGIQLKRQVLDMARSQCF